MSNPARKMPSVEIAAARPADDREETRSLVALAAAGDLAAARTLYDRHAGRVYRLAYRMCGDRDLASDLTQDVFVRVFGQLGQFRGEAAFTTWLHRVAVTTCLNTLRKVKRFRGREVDLEHASDRGTGGGDRDPVLQSALGAAIDALPEGLRIALVMHTIEGYTHAEIGAALGIAEGTSKSRVSEARALLRNALAPHGKEYHDE
ncbi:MAG TPA: RNA polymerase sigma factor [Gemmatimonadales bacterium]